MRARTDFLLNFILEFVNLVKVSAMARGHDQLGGVVAGSRITAHDRRGRSQEHEDERAACEKGGREAGITTSSLRGHCSEAARVWTGWLW